MLGTVTVGLFYRQLVSRVRATAGQDSPASGAASDWLSQAHVRILRGQHGARRASGFYVRVLEEGEVGAGDIIELVREDAEGMSVRAVCHLY